MTLLARSKPFLKQVLSQRFLTQAVRVKNSLTLALCPKASFDPAHLAEEKDLPLPEGFQDPAIRASWEEDHREIATVYGNGDGLGGVNPGDRQALYYLVLLLKPRKVLEIGTHIGASTVYLAHALRRLAQDGKIISTDIVDVNHPQTGPWKKLGLAQPPREFLDQLGCGDAIEFVHGPSQEFMASTKDRFDFIFLDGDHSAPAVYKEVSLALPLLNPGGSILLHDYYPGGKNLYPDKKTIYGPCQALNRIMEENPDLSVYPLGKLPWETKQGTNVTTLALVTRRG